MGGLELVTQSQIMRRVQHLNPIFYAPLWNVTVDPYEDQNY